MWLILATGFIYWLVSQHFHIWIPWELVDVYCQGLETYWLLISPVYLDCPIHHLNLTQFFRLPKNSFSGLHVCPTLSIVAIGANDSFSFAAIPLSSFSNHFIPSSKSFTTSGWFPGLGMFKEIFVLILLAVCSSNCHFCLHNCQLTVVLLLGAVVPSIYLIGTNLPLFKKNTCFHLWLPWPWPLTIQHPLRLGYTFPDLRKTSIWTSIRVILELPNVVYRVDCLEFLFQLPSN